MKLAIVVLSFFILKSATYAQNTQIDSLNRLIRQATTDTASINLTNSKIRLLIRINLDSAETLGLATLQKSKSLRYSYGEAAARINLASTYIMKGNFKKASENMNIAQKIFLDIPDSLGLSNTYSTYGMYYGMQSKYDSSITNLEKAISIAERNKFEERLATYYGNIAIGYQMQANFIKALEYQQKSLNLAIANKDVSNQAYIRLNMGLVFANMKDTLRARQSLLESIRLAKQEGIKNVELYAYSNLANLYSQKKDVQKEYEFAMKAAQLGQEMGDYGIQAASLSKAAGSLATMRQFPAATALAKKAIIIADSSGQTYNRYQAYSSLGYVLRLQNQYKAAIPYLEKSVAFLEKTDLYNEEVGNTYQHLSYCYEKTGNFSKALTFFKNSAQIADSVLSRDNIRRVTELSMNYEFNKKQETQRIEQKNKDAITQARQLALIVGLVLSFSLAAVAFWAYRQKQLANAQLQTQKEEIENTLTTLKRTQAQLILSEKMASLGELTAGIAHEIQNPLNFVNNFSEVSAELLDELAEEMLKGDTDEALAIVGDVKENLQKINHHGKRADFIVKGMLEHSRSSSGEKKTLDISKLTQEYYRLAYQNIRAKDKEYTANLITELNNDLPKIEVSPLELGRVLVNVFNNAFYATKQKKAQLNGQYQPEIKITTSQKNGYAVIHIRDNGTGMPENIKSKIFQPFFTTKPTGQGTGLGLSLSYDIITKGHQGQIEVKTEPGEYTEFIINLPQTAKSRLV
ncbi:tetratricopeptide repeat protein [Adhaeribacter pallidiroseus]|uniref:histidine kinase n=1 Tax=Adhaeribacter pallidiroseus TaxID=2072847 RepID=A0A369QJ53_9BACT|nr:tetratricopeptide repeat protein [Adhaeribacter pallidiroseus]RDC62318.1 Tetratricopeptide repeat protein [Adhaeribacter pallidiroseus]